jgi:hypothetical protein
MSARALVRAAIAQVRHPMAFARGGSENLLRSWFPGMLTAPPGDHCRSSGGRSCSGQGLCCGWLAAVPPGGVLVVGGACLQAAVQDAGQAAGDAAQRVGVVDVA